MSNKVTKEDIERLRTEMPKHSMRIHVHQVCDKCGKEGLRPSMIYIFDGVFHIDCAMQEARDRALVDD